MHCCYFSWPCTDVVPSIFSLSLFSVFFLPSPARFTSSSFAFVHFYIHLVIIVVSFFRFVVIVFVLFPISAKLLCLSRSISSTNTVLVLFSYQRNVFEVLQL